MSKYTNPLSGIRIASPCSADWNEMIGSERERFCGDCKLNVYNLSGMTQPEAERLLMSSEGRLCVRFYRRADGTILTKDCPVGWRALKKRVSKTAAAFASLLFGILSGLGFYAYFGQAERRTQVGEIIYTPPVTPVEKIEPLTGAVYVSPTEKEKDKSTWINGKPEYPIAGDIINVEDVRSQIKQKRRR